MQSPASSPTSIPVPRPLARALFGLGLGTLLFGLLLLELPAASVAGSTAVWVADRDADEVVGLDADGFVVERRSVRAPVALAPAPGGPWVASSRDGWALGTHDLVRLGPGSKGERVLSGLGPVLDLESLPDGGALLVELVVGGASRVLRTGGEGATPGTGALVLALPGATCAAGRSASAGGALALEVLVGDETGGLTLVREGQVVGARDLGGELGDLAPGPDGTWFALDVAGRRLCLLDADLALLWTVEHGLAASGLAPVPGEERVWLVDGTEPLVRRYGPGGVLELSGGLLATDAAAALASAAGGLWVATPGALLQLDGFGGGLPGQGGFAHLTDLCGAP